MAEIKMELEANLKCPLCGGIPYRLYRRELSPGSGIFENVLWPGPDGMVRSPTEPDGMIPRSGVFKDVRLPGSDGMIRPPPVSAELRCPKDQERLIRG